MTNIAATTNKPKFNNINSILYLCELLIEGKYIPQDLQRAKNYISNLIETNHQAFIIYGKIVKIENNPIEIIKYNQYGLLYDDNNCIHEYGVYLFKSIEEKSIDIKKCTFTNCHTADDSDDYKGGAIYIDSKTAADHEYLQDNIFENCSSTFSGGALFIYSFKYKFN